MPPEQKIEKAVELTYLSIRISPQKNWKDVYVLATISSMHAFREPILESILSSNV
jgi:hypothetical protein